MSGIEDLEKQLEQFEKEVSQPVEKPYRPPAAIQLDKVRDLMVQLKNELEPLAMGRVEGVEDFSLNQRLGLEGAFGTVINWVDSFKE